MVNVTKANFIEQSNDFLAHLPDAQFIAIDEEMTGISASELVAQQQPTTAPAAAANTTNSNSKAETPSQRYRREKIVPETYTIIQLGICLFFHNNQHEEEKKDNQKPQKKSSSSGKKKKKSKKKATTKKSSDDDDDDQPQHQRHHEWHVRRYNFYMFPPATTKVYEKNDKKETQYYVPRDVSLSANTMQYLKDNAEASISYDAWIKHGIPYMSHTNMMQFVARFVEKERSLVEEDESDENGSDDDDDENDDAEGVTPKQKKRKASKTKKTVQDVIKKRVELRRVDDIEFHATAMASLREWLDTPQAAPAPQAPPAVEHDDDDDGPGDEDAAAAGSSLDFDAAEAAAAAGLRQQQQQQQQQQRVVESMIEQHRATMAAVQRQHRQYQRQQQRQLQAAGGAAAAAAGGGQQQPNDQQRIFQRLATTGQQLFLLLQQQQAWMAAGASNPTGSGAGGAGPPQQQEEAGATAASQPPPEGTSCLLPACNSFLRRSLYETIEQQYPSLVLESVPATGGGNQMRIRVIRLSKTEAVARDQRLKNERWHHLIEECVGMGRIIEAIRCVCRGHPLDRTHVLFAPDVEHIDLYTSFLLPPLVAPSSSPKQQQQQQREEQGGDDVAEPADQEDATASNNEMASIDMKGGGDTVPLIVHNGFMDMAFLLSHFYADATTPLPSTLTEFKWVLRQYFPTIYDTKCMATQYCHLAELLNGGHSMSTTVDNLYQRVVMQPTVIIQPQPAEDGEAAGRGDDGQDNDEEGNDNGNNEPPPPLHQYHRLGDTIRVVNNANIGGSDDRVLLHEASYDAYMTGCIYIGLCQHIQRKLLGSGAAATSTDKSLLPLIQHHDVQEKRQHQMTLRNKFGCNLIHQHYSIFTMDLEEQSAQDPLSLKDGGEMTWTRQSVWHVSGFPPKTTTRDIVGACQGRTDSEGRRVYFEIVWIDDTSLLVTTNYSHRRQQYGHDHDEDDEEYTKRIIISIIEEHGRILYQALEAKFMAPTNGSQAQQQVKIVRLDHYLQEQQRLEEEGGDRDGAMTTVTRFLGRLWKKTIGFASGSKRTRNDATAQDQQSSNKRRRMN